MTDQRFVVTDDVHNVPVPDPIFSDPRLAALYDILDDDRSPHGVAGRVDTQDQPVGSA